MCTGVKALDSHADFLKDVSDVLQRRYWQQANQHYCGEGLQDGSDADSYRVLTQHLHNAPQIGHRLSEAMLLIAVGSTWSRARKKAEIPRFAGTGKCPRRQLEPETPLHR
eukprot:6946318-Pyramimonas_sp.AAC.1